MRPESFKIYSILFLIRCALICRLSDNWNLTYRSEYLNEITSIEFNYKQWHRIIATAERGLGKADLIGTNDNKGSCARILVEAGIPLYSLQNIKSNVVEGLKNIWEFSSSFPISKAYHQAVRNFETSHILKKNDGTILKLPGGNAGCEAFFSMGTKLLQDVISARLKRLFYV